MIKITINTDNAAFADDSCWFEVARILKNLAGRLECEEFPSVLKDVNGNSVGSVEYEED